MNPRYFSVAVLSGLFCLLLFPGTGGAEAALVAKVGSIPITVFELQRETQRILPLNVSFHGGVSEEKIAEVRQKALERLVERAYKIQYALAEELAVDNAAVEERIGAVRSRFKTPAEFEAALGKEGVAGFRASLYRDLLAAAAERAAVTDKVQVNEAEVRNYYQENQQSFKRPRQFKASHVLIKVDPASNAEERQALLARAEEMTARARAGEDFYNLAYYNSDDRSKFVGGDLGFFHEGQVVSEFEAALKKMKPGEISDPVKTRFGYHIIKLVEVNEPRQLTFEEMRDKIREKLETREREAIYQEWMAGLKAKYPVEIAEGP